MKELPGDVHALAGMLGDVNGRAATANEKLAAANDRLTETSAELATLVGSVRELAARPAPTCPACVCNERPPTADAKQVASPAPLSASTIAGKIPGADSP